MPGRFQDKVVDKEGRLSLGTDQDTGSAFLSIPVGNRMVDYEEYYRLTDEEAQRFDVDPAAARAFAEDARAHRHDDRLILKPGSDRGVPR